MALAPRRRRRRPRWLLLALLLSLLVLMVNGAMSARSKGPATRLAQLAYLDAVRPHVERSTEHGADLATVRDDASRLGRAGVAERLDKVTADARAVARAVQRVDPPPSMGTAHALLVSTVLIRARAAEAVGDGLAGALGTDPPEPAVQLLARAGSDMVTADGTYRVFLDALPRVEGNPAGAMPPSTWAPEGRGWSEPELSAIVRSLRSTSTLAPVHDVAVLLFTTEPAAVGTEGATSVLPAVKTLRLQVVVANTGNEPARRVAVVAALTADGVTDTARDFVDMAPGQRVAVTLGGLRPVAGATMTLAVTAGPVEGETSTADNQQARAVVFR
jgi:hypothetical protein